LKFMSMHREKIFERRGEGTLKPKNNDTIEIRVEFACYQYSDGNIEGTIKLLEEKHLDHKEYNLSARLENGERLYIENLRTRNSQSLWTDVRFDAFGLRLECREISSNRTKKCCKFGVSNMVQHEKLGIDIGGVTPVMAENQLEIWEYIRDRKVSCVTGYIEIRLDEEIKLNSVEEYKSELYEKIRRILLLTSLAKGTRIDWAYFELFEQIDEKSYERIYSERRAIPNKYTGMRSIISPLKLHEYLEIAYSNYTDTFDKNKRFDSAIYWYLESFLTNTIEPRYIKLFTALEVLVFGFSNFEGRKEIFTGEKDFEEFRDQLEEKIEGLLEDMDETKRESICKKLEEFFKECKNIFETEEDFNKFRKKLQKQIKNLLKEDIEKRERIYDKLGELNRYPFKINLELFLKTNHIKFNDDDDLKSLIKNRNELIHQGSTEESTSKELFEEEYAKLLPLIQRIFLSLLKYDGESTI